MTQHTTETIGNFYDQYAERQKRIGKNLRHYYLYREVLKAGLRTNHKVLEIGCGIGTFTELLADAVKKGKIVGTDISDKSIGLARQFFKAKRHLEFFTTDMSDFNYPDKFDYIVAADVLEHIPVAQHPALFATFRKHAHDQTVIFINIPHPRQIEILRKEAPETMQIIDQSVHTDALLQAAYAAGFVLHQLDSYSLFQEHPDYQRIIFKSLKVYDRLRPRSKWRIIMHKTRLRVFHFFSKF